MDQNAGPTIGSALTEFETMRRCAALVHGSPEGTMTARLIVAWLATKVGGLRAPCMTTLDPANPLHGVNARLVDEVATGLVALEQSAITRKLQDLCGLCPSGQRNVSCYGNRRPFPAPGAISIWLTRGRDGDDGMTYVPFPGLRQAAAEIKEFLTLP